MGRSTTGSLGFVDASKVGEGILLRGFCLLHRCSLPCRLCFARGRGLTRGLRLSGCRGLHACLVLREPAQGLESAPGSLRMPGL